jgi:hypothetical protein
LEPAASCFFLILLRGEFPATPTIQKIDLAGRSFRTDILSAQTTEPLHKALLMASINSLRRVFAIIVLMGAELG